MSTTTIAATPSAVELLRERSDLWGKCNCTTLLGMFRQDQGYEGSPYALEVMGEENPAKELKPKVQVGDLTFSINPEHLAKLEGLSLSLVWNFGQKAVIASTANEDFSEQPTQLIKEIYPAETQVKPEPDGQLKVIPASPALIEQFHKIVDSLPEELRRLSETMSVPETVLSLSANYQEKGHEGAPYTLTLGGIDVPDESWDGEKVLVGDITFHMYRTCYEKVKDLSLSLAHSFGRLTYLASAETASAESLAEAEKLALNL